LFNAILKSTDKSIKVDESFILQNCEDQKRWGGTAFEPSYPPPSVLPIQRLWNQYRGIHSVQSPLSRPFLQRGGTKGPRIGLARQDRFKAGIVWSQMELTFRCARSKASVSRGTFSDMRNARPSLDICTLKFRAITGGIIPGRFRAREKNTRSLSLFLLLPNTRRVRILRAESSSSLFRPILRRTWLKSEMIDGAAPLCVSHANLQFFARA